jgi:hypothetical protein
LRRRERARGSAVFGNNGRLTQPEELP